MYSKIVRLIPGMQTKWALLTFLQYSKIQKEEVLRVIAAENKKKLLGISTSGILSLAF